MRIAVALEVAKLVMGKADDDVCMSLGLVDGCAPFGLDWGILLPGIDELSRAAKWIDEMPENIEPWDITVDGAFTVRDASGKERTVCGQTTFSSTEGNSWAIRMSFGTGNISVITMAGNGDTPIRIVRAMILASIEGVATTPPARTEEPSESS